MLLGEKEEAERALTDKEKRRIAKLKKLEAKVKAEEEAAASSQ